MESEQKIKEFLSAVQSSLADGDFIKMSLGHYKGEDDALKKIYVKKLMIKREEKLGFTYRYKTRDIAKNYAPEDGLALVEKFLHDGFHAANLFTASFDLAYEVSHGRTVLKKTTPSHSKVPPSDHDKVKNRPIASDGKSYLHELNITDKAGRVYKNAQDKYRQINKYIEILTPLIRKIPGETLKVADMGSGKGYLTFALYDYLKNELNLNAIVTGVEYREDMVALCNKIAANSRFDELNFIQGIIDDYQDDYLDILIALHACDTATDDAIFKGIRADARLIVVAPCCHKQIRREMEKSGRENDVDFLVKHGILMERQAEMVTDGLRALILEYAGYGTKVFEFISGEHTAKNIMIVAERNRTAGEKKPAILKKIKDVKNYFGIEYHHLEKIMGL